MSEAARYRQQARDYEQRENWSRAIDAYEKAIKAEEERGTETDLSLFNRIGDLYRRTGDVNKAVYYYEKAVDGHMAAGFYNNAIALCNKILRSMPNRHSIYLKLGKIGAAKGFLSDARKHFLEYAERMQQANQLDNAFSALKEFADLSPDPGVRLMIADQLLEHEREEQAVEQLRLAWRHLMNDGRQADAREVRDRIVEIDPARDPEVDPPEESETASADAEGIIDLPEIEPYPIDEDEGATVDIEGAEIQPTAIQETEIEDAEVETEGVEVESSAMEDADTAADAEIDLEDESLEILPTSLTGEAEDEAAEAVEELEGESPADEDLELVPTSRAPEEDEEDLGLDDVGAVVDEEGIDLLGDDEEIAEGDEDLLDADGVDEDLEADFELDLDEPETEAEVEPEEVEPEAQVEPEGAEPEEVEPEEAEPEVDAEESRAQRALADRVAELRMRVETEVPDGELLVELADALLEVGDRAEATEHLREALALYEREGEFRKALTVNAELLRLDINDVNAHQKRVELALRTGERSTLIEAYLELADCLDRTDAGNKARVVYSRVLELDPDNRRARAALELLGDEETTAAAAAETETDGGPTDDGGGDYVDLGSLLQEEDDEKSTRFVVPTSDPESAEEDNFSEMLSAFKSKVSETIEQEDAASHYDLGLAFKEMGLIDEAIAEFQVAAHGREYRLRAIEMLGDCFMEKEDYRIAIKVLNRALQVPEYKDEDLIGIFYQMARSHEALEENERALEWYERVLGCDVNFADAAERVSALRS